MLFTGFVGDELLHRFSLGLFHKPLKLRIPIKQPGFNGMFVAHMNPDPSPGAMPF